jgi:hypothetical protein
MITPSIKAKSILAVLFRWTRLLFTPASLLIIAWLIWQSRDQLGTTLLEGNWLFLFSSVLLWMATHLLSPLVSVYVFKTCGINIKYTQTLNIHCLRLPAKYLPGGIWHSIARANDYFVLGHGAKSLAVYFIVENFLLVSVTLFMSAGIVHSLIAMPSLERIVLVLPLIMGLALVLFPFALRLFGKPNEPISISAYFTALVLLILYWCLVGLTFACYISAFELLGVQSSLLEIAGIYIFSWSLGYLAFFAPQGIGVAEFIAGNLLTSGDIAGQIVAFLFGFRFLILVADVACWVLALFVKKGLLIYKSA